MNNPGPASSIHQYLLKQKAVVAAFHVSVAGAVQWCDQLWECSSSLNSSWRQIWRHLTASRSTPAHGALGQIILLQSINTDIV